MHQISFLTTHTEVGGAVCIWAQDSQLGCPSRAALVAWGERHVFHQHTCPGSMIGAPLLRSLACLCHTFGFHRKILVLSQKS